MNVLLDTNIVVYHANANPKFGPSAKLVLDAADNHVFNAYISASAFTDLHYLLHKFFNDESITQSKLKEYLTFLHIIDTYEIDCINALNGNYNDLEDGVVAENAIRVGLDCIVTEDKNGFKKVSAIPIYTMNEFLKLL